LKKIYIPIAIINIILIIILINKAYIVTNISYKNITLLFIMTLLVFEFISYIVSNYKNISILLLILLLMSIAYIFIYKYSDLTTFFSNLFNLGLKINTLTTTSSKVDFSLIFPFYILIIPLLTFFYIILSKFNLGIVIILFNTAILLLYYLLGFNKETMYILPAYIFLNFINLNLFKINTIQIKKFQMKFIVIYYLIICITFSSIIYLLVPFTADKSTNWLQYRFNDILHINKNIPSDFATIGLNTSSTSFLGSKLQINNIRLSLLKGDVPKYLKTKVYYDYNYNRWIENRSLPSIKSKQSLNVANLMPKGEFAERNIKYNREKETKIKTISIETLNDSFDDVMISPNYITKVASPKTSNIYMYNNENYLTGQSQHNYTINYYDYSDTETIENYSNSPYKDDINTLNSIVGKNNINYELINDSLKFTSSERVRNLAKEITLGARDNNDKLKLIQRYLLNNYKYSLQPNAMNINSPDYVDFFLFNEKKGYCKSFATAAVMLCRAVGIPSRYVEGFKVRGEVDNMGNYVIRSYDAHAWVEVLTSADKGIWSILETTPIPDFENSAANDIEVTQEETNIQNTESPQERNLQNNAKQTEPNLENSNKEKQYNLNNKLHNINLIKNYNYILISGAIIIILILIKLLRRKFIIRRINNSESLIPLYIFILKRLKTINVTKLSYETDKEFALRIKDKLDIESLVEAVYKETYGDEKTILEKFSLITSVEKTVKDNSNILKYYIFF